MTPNDITLLRKSGKTDEAYTAARQLLSEQPHDISTAKALAWVLCDMLKVNATYNNRNKFAAILDELLCLNLPYSDAEYIYENLLYRIAALIYDTSNINAQDYVWLDALVDKIKSISFNTSSGAYRRLLTSAVKITNWFGLVRFVKWWNISNLTKADYQERVNSKGDKYMGVAEAVYTSVSRAMTLSNDNELILRYIERLDKIIVSHPQFSFLPYYKARLLLKAGEREKALITLKDFAVNKARDFWVWELMAEIADNTDDKLMYYCKALTCRNKDEMLVKLREKAGLFLASLEYYPAAKLCLEQVIKTRRKENRHPSYYVQRVICEQWWDSTQTSDAAQFIEQQSQRVDEQLLYSKVSGKLKKTQSGIGFVKEVFVPANLIQNIPHRAHVTVYAQKKFDKKKKQWGMAAVKIVQND